MEENFELLTNLSKALNKVLNTNDIESWRVQADDYMEMYPGLNMEIVSTQNKKIASLLWESGIRRFLTDPLGDKNTVLMRKEDVTYFTGWLLIKGTK